MRVTEGRLVQIASNGLSQARERAAKAGEALSTGVRVNKPSDDVVAWSEGMRSMARTTMSEGRGSAISRSRDALTLIDHSFGNIGNVLSRAKELAVELANGIFDASNRRIGATEIKAIRAQAISVANTRNNVGEYILAGTKGSTVPFDANGQYVGDATERQIEIAEGQRQAVSVTGALLTSSNGVGIFDVLKAFETALDNNDQAGLNTAIGDLNRAIDQVAISRAEIGGKMAALDAADAARGDLETHLAQLKARAIDADGLAATSELAQSQIALESARQVAEQLVAMAKPK